MKYAAISLIVLLPLTLLAEPLSYNRDVRPILADKCFHCHGPDKATRKPKSDPLRLDSFEGATQDQGGYAAVVPGKPEKSEMILRIFAKDEDDIMPPPDAHRILSQQQKETLRRWIKEGAKYDKHWAFVHPTKPPVPALKGAKWPRNEIDRFVLDRLAREKMQPSSEADKATLLRRATLAVTGLQPTPAEIAEFTKNSSPDAYAKLLDRLLASPRYGEHMAYGWIEAARYADTDGYQNDAGRTMWPWRDWVIKAFNDNMPYDEFSIKQLAGDMLPQKTPQDILASAFNRNHRMNNEGGALPEEFIVEYAVDRVETTSTIWLGLTSGCARCHDHKYDPLSQKEFFQLYSYFNNIPESGKATGAKAKPYITVSSPIYRDQVKEELLVRVKADIDNLAATPAYKKRSATWEKNISSQLVSDKSPWRLGTLLNSTVESLVDQSSLKVDLAEQPDGSLFATAASQNSRYVINYTPPQGMKKLSTLRLDILQHSSLQKPLRFSHGDGGNFYLTEFTLEVKRGGKVIPVRLGKADANFSQLFHAIQFITDHQPATGWALGGYRGKQPIAALIPITGGFDLEPDDTLIITMTYPKVNNPVTKPPNQALASFRISFHPAQTKSKTNDHLSNEIAAALARPSGERTQAQIKLIADYYLTIDPLMLTYIKQRDDLEKYLSSLAVRVPVMQENARLRPTYLLKRGQYNLPDKSEVLARSVPSWLGELEQPPKDRLSLARWLLSPKNPLAARAMVNRIWQQHFGVGLVKTADNLGLQGEQPSHPKLLDWLAVDFMENGWDIKRLHRMILMSSTWRQQSSASKAAYQTDPENRLLSRGPRFRLAAAAIRDTALHAAGLLEGEMGGPPVKPYQPKGLWNSVAHTPNVHYVESNGKALYRRDLYTYWKRAVNPPRMILFDAATRDYCTVLRKSTNTPLQALASMNDRTFVEAARHLGSRMMKYRSNLEEEKIRYGFQLASGRPITAKEMGIMKPAFMDFLNYYRMKPKEADAYIKNATQAPDSDLDTSQLAAYMATAHLMLNMDSTLHIE